MLAIVFQLVKAGEYFVCYCLAIGDCGRGYFVVYCLDISECWIIFCRLFFAISESGEYFVGYCLAICECWRVLCWRLS